MNHVKLVVFDIAGTTVKDNGEIAATFWKAMMEYGYMVPITKINTLMGYKKTDAIRQMVEEYEEDKLLITDDYISAIHERFLELMIEYYQSAEMIVALPNVPDVFAFLHTNNCKIGLDTGFSNDITAVIMQRLGWLDKGMVDYVVSSNEVPAGRPHPYMIQHLMQQAEITDTKQVIKVGDTEVDIQEGKNTGCLYSVAVTTGAFTRAELEPYEPSFIIDDMKELISIITKV